MQKSCFWRTVALKIERRVEENGAITDVITITEEENAAIDQAHEIVAERYKQMGLEQTAWEKEHLEYALQGRLRFDGLEGMLNWARTAVISKGKSSTPRGYC